MVQQLNGPYGCLEKRECGGSGAFARMGVSWEERCATKTTGLCGQGHPSWHSQGVRDANGDQALGTLAGYPLALLFPWTAAVVP